MLEPHNPPMKSTSSRPSFLSSADPLRTRARALCFSLGAFQPSPSAVMDFRLTRLVLEERCWVSVTEEEFVNIRDAQKSLVVLVSIEEKFNLLLENFVEFEVGLLAGALHHQVFQDPDRLTVDLQATNRRLVNLMTTGRLYLDQILHDLKATHPYSGDRSELVRSRIREEKQSNFDFRAIEAIRNFVQHRGMPVDVIRHGSRWHEYSEDERVCRHNLAPLLRIRRLEDDPKFSNSIAVELRSRGEEVDLRPLVRAYISSVGRIHEFVREQLAVEIATWKSVFLNAQERYRHECGSEHISLALVRHDGTQVVERFHLSHRLLDRYTELLRRNVHLTFHAKHVVTNAADLHRA